MKKTLLNCYIVKLLSIFIIFYLFIGGLNQVWAQGTFDCEFDATINGCVVKTGDSCSRPNYIPDTNVCLNAAGVCPTNNTCVLNPAVPTPTPGGGGVQTVPCNFDNNLQCLPTALGHIPVGPEHLVSWILRWSISLGGGIAFLLMVWGGFKILGSSGNPESLNEGKEIISSAMAGLLLIIFSLLLLRIIGYDILGIPGFIQP